ncbi:MAG: metal-dependent hydrolase [Pelotomaculum sp. PtaB.Bin104]|nr:MAG: metal-dependent hydrolase [Pelotomaculum sp. PtaB.Bin104]
MADSGIKIFWYGHSCFLIETPQKKIITDPFYKNFGYPVPNIAADIVTISHQHSDHNGIDTVPGKPKVVETAGEHNIDGVKITGVKSFHDMRNGSQRGENIIFVFQVEGIRICHLGDLGHLLDQPTLKQIGEVDVLLIPVGGYYTINAGEAKEVAAQLNPYLVVPMHYITGYIKLPIAPVNEFLKLYPNYSEQKQLEILAGKLPDQRQQVCLLDLASK